MFVQRVGRVLATTFGLPEVPRRVFCCLRRAESDGTGTVGTVAPTIKDRAFCVILGPSCRGKTTTLQDIAGLEKTCEGRILNDGKPVQNLLTSDRDIACVFQLYTLYLRLAVFENLAFPGRATRIPDAEARNAVNSAAQRIVITHLLQPRPEQCPALTWNG
jgi:ABC-type sugar transport system ATPase subunit